MKMVFISCINALNLRIGLKVFLIPNKEAHQ